MDEWIQHNLGELIEVQNGYAFKSKDFDDFHGIPVIKIKNVASGELRMDDIKYFPHTIEGLERFVIYKNDILIALTGSHVNQPTSIVGKVARYTNDGISLLNQRVGKIYSLNEKKTNEDYIYWFFKQWEVTLELALNAGGSANQANISGKLIKTLELELPPLPEQKAIASFLSSLDDKIDLLNRQNKTLEAMAETLFRQWFIKESQKDWEEVKLEEYVDCITGYSYKSIDLNPSNIALVTLKNFARDGSFRMDGFKEYTGGYKESQVVKQGDLVVSHTDITQEGDIIGNPTLVIDTGQYDTLVITMDLMKVESTKEWLSKEFLFYLFKSPDFKFHCLGCSNGTTVLHMSRKAIPSYEFKIPNKEKVTEFTEIIKPIIDKKFKNILQIRILEKLRDTLLPKLMSGEVRVEYDEN